MSRVNPVDEGLIHAWIEGQLPPDEAARVERLVATDADWGAAVAEARGLIAGASRILGALDDVPRVGQAKTGRREDENTGEPRDKRELRAWWRAPWMRAAAGLVLVAGVSSAVWMRGDFRARPALDKLEKRAADGGAPQARAQDETKTLSAPRERKEASDVALQRAAEAPPNPARPAAAPPVREQSSVADSVAASGARADANRPAGAVGGVPTPPKDSGVAVTRVAGIGGGRGAGRPGTGGGIGSGIGGASGGVQTNAAFELSAKTVVGATSVDARLAGCWVPISSLARAEERERAAEAQRESSPVLRFIRAVMTDAVAAPPPVTRQAAAQSSTAMRVNAPPMQALSSAFAARSVVNATVIPAVRPDSAFTAEWIDQRGRNIATFIVRGDTLRGTSRTLPADSARVGAPFVAARVECAP